MHVFVHEDGVSFYGRQSEIPVTGAFYLSAVLAYEGWKWVGRDGVMSPEARHIWILSRLEISEGKTNWLPWRHTGPWVSRLNYEVCSIQTVRQPYIGIDGDLLPSHSSYLFFIDYCHGSARRTYIMRVAGVKGQKSFEDQSFAARLEWHSQLEWRSGYAQALL